ncbi:MAG: hypothetical protein DRJ66_03225 [Thermoprotei archaeon]|nr:MAG: hypothetical protein DRJ66_03225 [Thermoprotei archaeon]RLF21054.1 MAG: hypothetical protein DRZ82_00255 [Thermoprotei archaeon]
MILECLPYVLTSTVLLIAGLYGISKRTTPIRILISLELIASGALGYIAFLSEALGLHKAVENLIVVLLAIDSTLIVLVILVIMVILKTLKECDISKLSGLKR